MKKASYRLLQLNSLLVGLIFYQGSYAQTVSTLAGSTQGDANGVGTNAMFNNPSGVCSDAAGNIYVADIFNNKIRKITPSGAVSTLAGSTAGYADGTGATAQFSDPINICSDAAGNLYLADQSNDRIRKITPSGTVSTFAGSTQGYADGMGAAAQFVHPTGICSDAAGNMYVTDQGNSKIRKITPSGMVTTIAGSSIGYADGASSVAKFNNPTGICIDAAGNLYVADYANNKIRKITPSGTVSTFAGSAQGYTDGTGTAAQFYGPTGICIDASGNLYVADYVNHKIRKITPAGVVTTFAGSTGGYANGAVTTAQFYFPYGVCLDAIGNVYVGDQGNQKIRKIGINNLDINECITGNYSIYPNPNNGSFTLELGKEYSNVRIDVTDVAGKQIEQIEADNTQMIQLCLNAPKGMYFVSIFVSNGSKTVQKIIVQ